MNLTSLIRSACELLDGRKVIVVKPRDPERPLTEGGLIVRVEDVRGRG